MTLGQFMFFIKKKMELDPNKALFIMISDQMRSGSCTMGELYTEFKDTDNFLYIKYALENTFG